MSRRREESPLGKRVVAVLDATVLDWFRRGWGRDTPEEWIAGELGGEVQGLDSIFDEARKGNLPEPQFDTRWASAHPDLARSLLRYAAHWDPYGL